MTDRRYTPQHSRPRLPRAKKSGDEDPKTIGHWKIGKTIGKGSSGRVKIARHLKTHQYAAIKIVSKHALIHSRMSMADAPAQAEKVLLGIEREIVIMKLIDHPNVLNLYDVWETGNELYLIMEYVEGGELFDYLVSRGRLSVDEALHYFQQIISAVSYCHGFNIAHRDLKPENLLLSKSSSGRNIKVADFGMAAYTDPAAMLSTSCGSPHYASPEVVEGRFYKGNVSDVWSCGVILYALLAGRLPFDDGNLRVLLEKVKMATYHMPIDMPPAAQDLISRMLERDVTRRITMSQIRVHPFFLSPNPSPSLLLDAQTPTLEQLTSGIEKPVQSEEEIDADIFDNLRTLWHGAPMKEIIDGLLNDQKTWEKAVYHLLLKYRSKHMENYNMDEDDENRDRQRRFLDEASPGSCPSYAATEFAGAERPSKTADDEESELMTGQVMHTAGQRAAEDPSPTHVPRPSAPTPQRAVHRNVISLDTDPDVDMSMPRHVRMAISPVAPLPPPFPTVDLDADVFTSPHCDLTITSPRPTSLPLPVLFVSPVGVQSSRPVLWLPDASSLRPEQAPMPSVLASGPSPTPILDLPGIDVPNLKNVDETVQRFFHQLVDRLNTIQLIQSHPPIASRPVTLDPDSSDAPDMLANPRLRPGDATKIVKVGVRNEAPPPPPTTPSLSGVELNSHDSRFEDAIEDIGQLPILGLGISDYRPEVRGTSPAPHPQLQHQQRLRPPPPRGRAYSSVAYGTKQNAADTDRSHARDKENTAVWKNNVEPDGAPMRKKSSLRNTEGGRTLRDKHVQIVLPYEAEEMALNRKKSSQSTGSARMSPALSDGMSFLPGVSSPRRSWFGNLFKFKPASYNLLSVHDALTTREECARLLREFGVSVLLITSEANGALKCKLEEIRDPAGVMAVAKAVQFRVELHAVTYAHSISGYMTSLTIVQEKGALSSFKLVYNRLRREWILDTPPSTRTPSSVYGPLASSPGLAPGRFAGGGVVYAR